jgi:hypothetical protein
MSKATAIKAYKNLIEEHKALKEEMTKDYVTFVKEWQELGFTANAPLFLLSNRPKTIGDAINNLEHTLLLVELNAHISMDINEEEGLALFEEHTREVAAALEASKSLWATAIVDWHKYVAAIQAGK